MAYPTVERTLWSDSVNLVGGRSLVAGASIVK